MRIRRWRRVYLAAEYAALFFGATTVYNAKLRGTPPIPVLLALALGANAYLRRSAGFDRGALWRPAALRSEIRPMAALAGASALGLTGAVATLRREHLFELPRRNPLLWAAVMVLYPVLSVYPQELVYRSFLFHRYAPVFGDGLGLVAASAAAFGYVHIVFGSWISVVLSGAGGWIFALRYLRTNSLFAASADHAVYGMMIFTIGLGQYFYHGAANGRTLSSR